MFEDTSLNKIVFIPHIFTNFNNLNGLLVKLLQRLKMGLANKKIFNIL